MCRPGCSISRLVTIVFKAIPFNIGVDEAGAQYVGNAIALAAGVIAALKDIGYRAHPFQAERAETEEAQHMRWLVKCLAVAGFGAMNIMQLKTPESAILSAVIFNALIIVALVPLALRGVQFTPLSAAALLRRNLLVYGLGGIVAPFAGIKLIDVVITTLGLA